MNILYTAYYGLGKGGAEVSMTLLASTLVDNHKIIIASTEDYKGFKTYKFSKYAKCIPSFKVQNDYMANFFSRVIRNENIDIIHSHDSRTAIAAILAAKKNNIKSVTHYRDYWFCCPKSSLLKMDLTSCEECNAENLKKCSKKTRLLWDMHKLAYLKSSRHILNSADEKIAISRAVRNKLHDSGINEAKIIANGINLELFKKTKLDESDRNVVLGYVGSLSYNKGLQTISKAIGNILRKYAKTKLIVIGEGELKKGLIEEFKEFEERVLFMGNLDYNSTIKEYGSIDIILIPSAWQEPFSRVAIEAMAAGKPMVASNVGGLREIVKKDFGFLIDAKKTQGWENAVEALLSEKTKRNSMGKCALRESKKYDIKFIAKKIDGVYKVLHEK
ncbi:glycosyltransferase family 4 protein [Candidatus Woesearchaeota archaeon]|nr:glycosyltransferase family 4 protein [Candidatus Woesearchaeota archaeon]